ncbi:MAG: hypothetical protein K6G92_08150 [Bacteroidaceae bacterium]|nr:hypothetical protein [Bacteroidaceae bacterium]
MDKKLLIEQYLQGKHPIEHETWDLPTDSELDRDEALYDALIAEKKAAKQIKFWPYATSAIAAAACVLIAFLLWPKGDKAPQDLAEVPDEQVEAGEDIVPQKPEEQPVLAQVTVHKEQRPTPKATKSLKNSKPQPTPVKEAQPTTETVVLTNAADSLYYYLTQLENEMGECRDSACLTELGNLMRADERIKDLVNKIIHKQVETAYQEEYLVDTTTRYIPL